MRTETQWTDVAAAAGELAGNWKDFDSFGWYSKPDDCERWAIVYTHNRDSGLLDQSNAAEIAAELAQFQSSGDIKEEDHNHWACGWIKGYALRVYDENETLTPVFQAYCGLMARLADYPILDEEDYSLREHEAALEYIEQARPRCLEGEPLPEHWPAEVFSWLWDHEQRECENPDDTGAAPSDESIMRAIADLWPRCVVSSAVYELCGDDFTYPESIHDTPIVYVTASGEQWCQECSQAELDSFIESPIRFMGGLPVGSIWHAAGPVIVCALCGTPVKSGCGSKGEQ